jgi:hypothetical protein
MLPMMQLVPDDDLSDQSTPMSSPTFSSQGENGTDESSEFGDVDTAPTSGDEDEPLNEKSPKTSENSTQVDSPSEKCPPPVVPSSPSQNQTSDAPKVKRVSWSDIFIPKIKIIKILFEVDFVAGCIVTVNTILQGFINSMKTTAETALTASVLELIMTKTFDSETITRLLVRRILLQAVFHCLLALNHYAHRRSRRPLQKKLQVDIMQAYADLPYEMMLDKKISNNFIQVFPALIGADISLPGLLTTFTILSLQRCRLLRTSLKVFAVSSH